MILVIIAFVLVTALIATALYFQRDSDDQNSNGSSNQSEQGTSEESQDENSGVTVEPNIITVEARGIWFDPIYTANTPEDIIKAIDMIADAGFNQVYLAVTTGEGYAQYRSGVLPMLDKYQGFDPAKVAIEQAHKRGMEVHAHMLTLANPQQIYAHPEWDQQRFNKNAKIAVLGDGKTRKIDNENDFRQTNFLTLYTPDKAKTTGANIWGSEVVVENNVVIAVNIDAGDSEIQENGFVLSGNGQSSSWIAQNIKVGDTITIEPDPEPTTRDSGWMEPGNPEVVAYLQRIVKDMLTKLDLDGISFDIIRYPPPTQIYDMIWRRIFSTEPETEYTMEFYGYSKLNRERFKEKYNVDPLDITPDDKEMFDAWIDFRSDIIQEFLTQLADTARSVKPGIVVSASPTALSTYDDWDIMYSGLDYRKLAEPLDVVIPMAYHALQGEAPFQFPDDPPLYDGLVARGALERIGDKAKLYVGIGGGGGNHEQLTAPVWNHVIDIVRENNAHGTVVFDYYVMGHLTEDPENFIALKNGAYNEPAKELSQ
ncbi:MAG: family 10 glycosylhydrolase [Eubacteriales bacterium]|nr:family 10 glycosylhydrolase [Eubacteriales bacterium]